MDINVARTFLEVVKTGSFVNAAANLNLTQTAVSARIRVLEEQLDRKVFVRNKAGARLTSAGEQFFRFATSLVQIWDRARRSVANRRRAQTRARRRLRRVREAACGSGAVPGHGPG